MLLFSIGGDEDQIYVKSFSEKSFQYRCSVNAISYIAFCPSYFDTECMSVQRVCKWGACKMELHDS